MKNTRSPLRFSLSHIAVLILLPFSASLQAQSPNAFAQPTADNPNPAASIAAMPGSRAQGWQAQGRSELVARHGVVATSDSLASHAGLEILMKGGNAIDAAVAAAAALDVTSQNDTTIGGDLFALVWVASEQKLYALNSAGWAPSGWTLDYFRSTLELEAMPSTGVNSTTVPGAIAGYEALLSRFGTMGFEQTFQRAVQLAEEGWGQSERRFDDITSVREKLLNDDDSARTFLVDGEVPPLYSLIRNPELADALRLIQREGAKAFYEGAIAEAIVTKVREAGGVMSREDLAEFSPEWVEPISTNYHGYDVHQLPPPGQGFATLQMLNILEVCAPVHGLKLADLGPTHPDYWHFMVEAKKLAYSDLQAYNADPLFEEVPVQRLLDKSYAASLCNRIDMAKATPPSVTGGLDGGTVYLATADRWGNMVSLVHSGFSVYASGVTVPPYGFVLQNRGAAFSLQEGHPNQVEPRKRPFHTIIAGFVTRNGEPLLAFGNMGGSIQPESHVQHIVNLIDHGMNLQMTTDTARFTHNQNRDLLSLESALYNLVGSVLEARGHDVRAVNGSAVGGYQGILFTRDPALPIPIYNEESIRADHPVNGVYRAGSDHRKDGQALGW
jgi:gamma-glutamyltranspeptidase / glutathione hydrolase